MTTMFACLLSLLIYLYIKANKPIDNYNNRILTEIKIKKFGDRESGKELTDKYKSEEERTDSSRPRNPSPLLRRFGNEDTYRIDGYQPKEKDRSREKEASLREGKETKRKTEETKLFIEKGIKKELSSDSEDSDNESRISLRQSLQKRLRRNTSNNEECSTADVNKIKEVPSSPNSENSLFATDVDDTKVRQKKSLLEKVNEIIKSCVKLKDENKVTGSKLEKANNIIQKAEEKKFKLKNKEGHEIKTLK
jgi:hypothetical protein